MAHVPDLILGLDGGGTKTLLAVADRDGAVLHLSRHPSLDPFAYADWRVRMEGVMAAAHPFRHRLADAVLGLPCHGEIARQSQDQLDAAEAFTPCRPTIINDVEAAFEGALAGTPGVLLLAGTGSMAWAGDARHSIRCGGWGDAFGDEGSAYWIGREALALASQALDGRAPHEDFARALLAEIDRDADELLAWCYDLPARRTTVAALAAFVDRRAETGDGAASDLLMRAGDALADHAEACMRRLDLPRPVSWSHAGSVFRSRIVMAQLTWRLEADPLPPRLPPVGGALLRAARQAGWDLDQTWLERLGRALAERECDAGAS